MYINNSLSFDVKPVNIPSLESIFIDVLLPHTKPITFGVCYRPPRDSAFLDNLESVFNDLNLDNEVYVMGDFNICTKQKSCLLNAYQRMLNKFSFTQIIDQPTRLTSNSSSIIDHILCSPNGKIKKSGVLDVSLSDHQFSFFKRGHVHNPCLEPVIKRFRCLKNYCKATFCFSLSRIDWRSVLTETNVDLALQNFTDILLSVIDEIAPYNQTRVKHNTAPWMCREILSGIRKRDGLFRKFKKSNDNEILYAAYRKQRNAVQRDIKLAKSEYFKNKLNECGGDSAKLWRRLSSLGYGEAKSKSSIVLENDGEKVFDAPGVTKVFNEFFYLCCS